MFAKKKKKNEFRLKRHTNKFSEVEIINIILGKLKLHFEF